MYVAGIHGADDLGLGLNQGRSDLVAVMWHYVWTKEDKVMVEQSVELCQCNSFRIQ